MKDKSFFILVDDRGEGVNMLNDPFKKYSYSIKEGVEGINETLLSNMTKSLAVNVVV